MVMVALDVPLRVAMFRSDLCEETFLESMKQDRPATSIRLLA